MTPQHMHLRGRNPRARRWRRLSAMTVALAAAVAAVALSSPAEAASYVPVTGAGSSWAGDAWAQWSKDAAADGVTVTYTPNGSSAGRDQFAQQTSAMFADSEIPFTGDANDPQDNTTPNFKYSMLPVVAGGTAFAYNLPVGTQPKYSGLKLNMSTLAGIFSGKITKWNDSAIAATNPGVALPNHTITVAVRSDGSGATAQFKLWMLRQYPSDYAYLAGQTGGDASHASSYYPVGNLGKCSSSSACFVAQNGSQGVTTYVSNTPYSIDYDEYAYPLAAGLPVVKVENAAGYYTLPTADAVAVALTQAVIDTNKADPNYLSQDLSKVYGYKDPRSYPMSMYSYEMIPDQTTNVLNSSAGASLAWVSSKAVCEWQREMPQLGYSPLPMNLALASLSQITGIPGIDAATKKSIADTQSGVTSGSNPCNNPTFKPGDSITTNELVKTAPFPAGCDAACQAPWAGKDSAVSGPGSTGTSTTSTTPTQQTTTSSTGTSGSSSTSTGATASGTGSGTSTQSCDSDTGVCTTTDTTTASNVKAVPTVISETSGWGSSQTLMAIIVALLLVILIVPPVVGAVLTRRGRP